jgi:uncharacterized membrane protein YfcA
LEPGELGVLCFVALATSMLSAIVGMAGGITLLAVMLLFLPPLVAIPLHGVVQLVSNGSRVLIQRKHVDWTIMLRYGVLLLPMGFVGLAIAQRLPPSAARVLIGAFVLIATWRPGWVLAGTHPERSDPRRRFVALGGVVGVLNMTIGATGPLIAPFFLNLGLARQAVVGTKAACQTLGHLVKIAVFGFAGFAFAPYAARLLLLGAAVVAGTWIGSQLLERVSEVWFVRLYKGVLTLIALRLVIWEGLEALAVVS